MKNISKRRSAHEATTLNIAGLFLSCKRQFPLHGIAIGQKSFNIGVNATLASYTLHVEAQIGAPPRETT
jgi:hypothetical protein